jgi:hypothetical protein
MLDKIMEDNKNLYFISQAALVIIGVIIGGFISSYTGFTFPRANLRTIDYLYCYSTRNVDMGNAEWKIVFCVRNTGRVPLMLTNVYVDEEDVQTYGLIHGESLDSGVNIGTNLPISGYELERGKGFEIYVWIRGNIYEPGDKVYVSMNRIGFFTKKLSITLSRNEFVDVDKDITF